MRQESIPVFVRSFFVLLLIVAAGIVSSSDLLATETPCEPCDSASTWDGPHNYQTSAAIPGSNCTLTVSYSTRICYTTGEPQIKIHGITLDTNCLALSLTAEEIAILAMAELLQANPMGFAPTTVGSTKNWVVIRPACWQRSFASAITGCSTECCTSRVTAELFSCNSQTTRGLRDYGYPNTITSVGSQVTGCICNCNNIFSRYREIIGNASNAPLMKTRDKEKNEQ